MGHDECQLGVVQNVITKIYILLILRWRCVLGKDHCLLINSLKKGSDDWREIFMKQSAHQISGF